MKHWLAALAALAAAGAFDGVANARTAGEILNSTAPEEWRAFDPEQVMVMTLADGAQVLIEFAPAFAPLAIANIKTLVRQNYFDGLAILRVQDNYVTQWGDPRAGSPQARSLGSATSAVRPEWSVRRGKAPFVELRDGDVYADDVGFSAGFPAARNGRDIWLTHCYGMVGVGREEAPESGSGAELYVVIGHAARHLDRNITLVGRVIEGMEKLSAFPRGTGPLGFYEVVDPSLTIQSVRIAADLPGGGPAAGLQALKESSKSFKELIEARRNREDAWYHRQADAIDLCNVPLPVRRAAPAG